MRIHTDTLTTDDLYYAVKHLPGVYITWAEHGSRSRDHAFDITLEGNGTASNSGRYGAGSQQAATWDEWGAVLATLYERDAEMLCGSASHPVYRDAEDFHYKTHGRFVESPWYLPDDTHKRHTWKPTGTARSRACSKCSAVQIFD